MKPINQFPKYPPATKVKFCIECLPGSLIQCQKRSSYSIMALEEYLVVCCCCCFSITKCSWCQQLNLPCRKFSLLGTKEWVKPSVVCLLSLQGSLNKVSWAAEQEENLWEMIARCIWIESQFLRWMKGGWIMKVNYCYSSEKKNL